MRLHLTTLPRLRGKLREALKLDTSPDVEVPRALLEDLASVLDSCDLTLRFLVRPEGSLSEGTREDARKSALQLLGE